MELLVYNYIFWLCMIAAAMLGFFLCFLFNIAEAKKRSDASFDAGWDAALADEDLCVKAAYQNGYNDASAKYVRPHGEGGKFTKADGTYTSHKTREVPQHNLPDAEERN